MGNGLDKSTMCSFDTHDILWCLNSLFDWFGKKVDARSIDSIADAGSEILIMFLCHDIATVMQVLQVCTMRYSFNCIIFL